MRQPAYVFFIVMPELAREAFGKAPPGAASWAWRSGYDGLCRHNYETADGV
jgi:hypothetical protein